MHLQCKGHGFDPWAEMAAHFGTLAWETHGQRSLQATVLTEVSRARHNLATTPPPPRKNEMMPSATKWVA